MISLSFSVSGGQVGRELQNDPEELAYALDAISEDFPADLPEEVAEYLDNSMTSRSAVVALLRGLLAAIDPTFDQGSTT
ncbi:MAG: hypothetical protein ACK46Q_12800 [Hyphomonas sp.]